MLKIWKYIWSELNSNWKSKITKCVTIYKSLWPRYHMLAITTESDSQVYNLWWQWNIYTWHIHLKAFVLCAIYQSMFLVRNIFVIISDTEDIIHTIMYFFIRFCTFVKFRIDFILAYIVWIRHCGKIWSYGLSPLFW